jgi:feruloyl esterase
MVYSFLNILSLFLRLFVVTQAQSAQTCSDLLTSLNLTSDVKLILTAPYPDNTTFLDPYSLSYPQPAPNLPAFCRVYANISTSPTSRTLFEVWLPLNTWNGRYMTVGNGAGSGGVNYPAMGISLRAGFAVASTDAGHNSTGIDGAWESLGPEVAIDFGYRAVHLTTVYAKSITTQFYKTDIKHAYYTGCSSGGKQGLKSVQMFPEDFDGALVGAPAYSWNHLNAYSLHVNSLVADNSSPSYIPPAQYGFLGAQVSKECDLLDGVADGVISNPRVCNFRTESLLCQYFPANTIGCFTPAQVVNLENIYRDYIETNGTYIFPAFEKGSEAMWSFTVTGFVWPLITSYYAVQVLNVSDVGFNVFSVNLTVLQLADKLNPGGVIADDPDLQPFFARNGRLLHYHGWADGLIPSRTSIDYYNSVSRNISTDFSDYYRLFMIPGMGHCAQGPGPWIFNTDPAGAAADTTADLVNQLLAWVELGVAPDTLLGTKYVNDTGTQGIAFQRPICPYPNTAVWTGQGQWEDPANWKCQFV